MILHLNGTEDIKIIEVKTIEDAIQKLKEL